MTIDYDRLLNRAFVPVEQAYAARETILYALGVGLGSAPLDRAQLPFVYEGLEGGLRALPTMAAVLGYPGFWPREPDTGIDWRRLLHAEQTIELHKPVPPQGRIVGRNRIVALYDRGAGKGAFMGVERRLEDAATGELLATVSQLNLLRGDGGFGGPAGAPPAPHAMPERAPDLSCALPTLPQAALIYRLSGDFNPLHADPAVARGAGFERPILHGLCTMGVAGHAVLRALLDYDARRFAAMRVRFTAPAIPGDTLRTDLWVNGSVVSLRCTAVERDVVVLDRGRVDLRPSA